MIAVLMAAGKSTRTYPLTLTRPKPLLPVMDKPILARQLDALHGLVDRAVVVIGYRGDMIRERFGKTYRGIALTYVEQKEQKGTGHAVQMVREAARKEPFLVLNGDDLYAAGDLATLAQTPNAALAKGVGDVSEYGSYEAGEDNRVRRLVEKPPEGGPGLCNVGAYHFTPRVFEILDGVEPSSRGEVEITAAVQALAEEGAFTVVPMEGYWLPIGSPWRLLEANAFFLEHFLRPGLYSDAGEGVTLSGPAYIGPNVQIRPGTLIEGPVYVGEGASLGPNCWLRPGATLGPGSRVGQGSEIKNAILMANAAAPHQNYVGDSVIGEGVNLGCGTVTANLRHDNANVRSEVNGELVDTGRRKLGAIIGDHVHTGIHTSIYPGRKIWPGMGTRPGAVVDRDITG